MEDLSSLPQALVQTTASPPSAYANLPLGSFVIIHLSVCFKKIEARYLSGLGDTNLARTLEQI